MDSQAYRVAVLLTLNDQLSKNLAKVGRDAKELGGKFDAINKSIQAITKSSDAASKALEKLNRSLSNPASGQATGAKSYADSMERAAKAAKQIVSSSPASSAMVGSMVGIAATSSIAAKAGSGGGRMLPPSGGALMLAGPGGSAGKGWRGWNNGVPPGGWGGGGSGSTPGGGANGGGGYGAGHGMENLAIAYGGFQFMQSAVEAGAEYQTLLARFSAYGMGDAAVKEADKFAQATKVMGASKNDMLRFFVEAQGVFRESGELTTEDQLKGARLAAPMMAKMQFAMASMDPAANHMTHAKEMDMLRFVEQAGGLNSPAKFNSIMNNAYKAVQSSGGNIDFSQLRQFMARAGTSAYNLSDSALYAKLEPIIGEMKGGAAGDALMTAYNRLTGTIKLPNQVVKQLEDMGVWDKSKIIHNSMGGIKSIVGGPGSQLTDLKLLASDPVEFYEKVIRPKYAAKGMSEEQIQLQNNVIFGRQGGKMFNLIEKQMHVIDLAAKAFEKQMGIDDASRQTAGTYTGKRVDFDAKWKDFQLALAQDGGLLDTFTKGLTSLTTFLQKLTEFSNAHPKFTSAATSLLEVVTALAAFKGGVWLLKHAVGAIISPLDVLSGSQTGSLLRFGAALTGLPGIIAMATLAALYPTSTVSQTQENAERDRLSRQNASDSGVEYKPWSPTQADFEKNQAMDQQYRKTGKYPEPPSSNHPVQVTSKTYLDGKQIAETVTTYQSKQAARAPASTSGIDATMNLIHAGMGSAGYR
ncbi:hypothetical protein MXF26_12210 [Pantoea dispersa]|uniref:hypothetical protein n=1 Tax=Pantoea dispersa TaxID=59814 RepID=UPI002DB89BF2|nr:hypothetical protein [Pantoea dispersa]MEB5837017.1 hypothetical protein [Pantoea dispersa]